MKTNNDYPIGRIYSYNAVTDDILASITQFLVKNGKLNVKDLKNGIKKKIYLSKMVMADGLEHTVINYPAGFSYMLYHKPADEPVEDFIKKNTHIFKYDICEENDKYFIIEILAVPVTIYKSIWDAPTYLSMQRKELYLRTVTDMYNEIVMTPDNGSATDDGNIDDLNNNDF